jgi:addiction module RelE/StbE family toxin
MRDLVLSSIFARRYKKLVGKHSDIQSKIRDVLELLREDPFTPALETHKLKGKYEGNYACTVAYDLRIIFEFESRVPPEDAAIVLLNIGTHDKVYP